MEEYLNFVRYCIDEKQCIPSIKDWDALFLFMQQQALVGIGFRGLERMKQAGVDVPRDVVLKWYAMSEQIKQANQKANKACVEVSDFFRAQGFRSCILKGQGNTLYYPAPYIRTSGDIDIWLEGGHDKIMNFVNDKWPGMLERYHHVEVPAWNGVAVEIHFTPSYMHAPWMNKRMQQWLSGQAEEQFTNRVGLPDGAGSICVPTLEFNLIYQLSHIYRHLFSEGIGLRQIVDYYYLLRKAKDESEKLKVKSEKFFDENSGLKSGNLNAGHVGSEGLEFRDESLEFSLSYLGLYKFAGAVMWVLHEVLGLEDRYLIVEPNEKEGRFLLNEIMIGGNFGQYDRRLGSKEGEGIGHRYFRMTLRNMRYVKHYPSEALFEPLFRTWHFFWRVLVKFRV